MLAIIAALLPKRRWQTLASKMQTFASVDAWRAAFDATQLTCWLITGGEPSAYPDFVELCGALTGQSLYLADSIYPPLALPDSPR